MHALQKHKRGRVVAQGMVVASWQISAQTLDVAAYAMHSGTAVGIVTDGTYSPLQAPSLAICHHFRAKAIEVPQRMRDSQPKKLN